MHEPDNMQRHAKPWVCQKPHRLICVDAQAWSPFFSWPQPPKVTNSLQREREESTKKSLRARLFSSPQRWLDGWRPRPRHGEQRFKQRTTWHGTAHCSSGASKSARVAPMRTATAKPCIISSSGYKLMEALNPKTDVGVRHSFVLGTLAICSLLPTWSQQLQQQPQPQKL